MRAALLTTLLVSSLTGQTVWIVDASGRGQFRDLPPALAAAQDGDTIVVWPASSYQGGSTNRGITLLALSGSVAQLSSPFTVHDLPAGRTFVMDGFFCPGLTLLRCDGRVHLENVRVTPTPATPSLQIDRCATVTLNLCGGEGGSPGLRSTASRMTASGCTFSGAPRRGGGVAPAGMELLDSVCVVGDLTFVEGGSSLDAITEASAGIVQVGTDLTLSNCTVAAGGNGPIRPTPAVFAARPGSVTVDPDTRLFSSNGGARFLADVPVLVKPVASVSVVGVPPGRTLVVQLRAKRADLAVLLIARPGDATAVASLGHLWVQPAGILASLTSTIGQNGLWTSEVPVPLDVPTGLPVAFQAFAGQNGVFHLSAPVIAVIN